MDILPLFILCIGGILTGLYASSVGGGSLITFPLLILMGLPTQIAIATNRLGIVLLECSSAIKFYRENKLSWKWGIPLGIVAAIGSFIGSHMVITINERLLNIIVALLLAVVVVVSLKKNTPEHLKKNLSPKNTLILVSLAFLLGIYGGFFGAGFGIFIMFVLVAFRFTFLESASLGRLIGFMMSLTASLVFVYNGSINYAYAFSVGIGSAIGSWFGIGIALKKGDRFVRILFIVIIVVTILKLILEFFNIKLW